MRIENKSAGLLERRLGPKIRSIRSSWCRIRRRARRASSSGDIGLALLGRSRWPMLAIPAVVRQRACRPFGEPASSRCSCTSSYNNHDERRPELDEHAVGMPFAITLVDRARRLSSAMAVLMLAWRNKVAAVRSCARLRACADERRPRPPQPAACRMRMRIVPALSRPRDPARRGARVRPPCSCSTRRSTSSTKINDVGKNGLPHRAGRAVRVAAGAGRRALRAAADRRADRHDLRALAARIAFGVHDPACRRPVHRRRGPSRDDTGAACWSCFTLLLGELDHAARRGLHAGADAQARRRSTVARGFKSGLWVKDNAKTRPTASSSCGTSTSPASVTSNNVLNGHEASTSSTRHAAPAGASRSPSTARSCRQASVAA